MKQVLPTWALSALLLAAGCAKVEPAPPTRAQRVVAPAVQPAGPATAAAPQSSAPHDGVPTVSVRGTAKPETPAASKDLTETDVLSIYREVYCLRKRGDEEGVFRIWKRRGVDSAAWAKAVKSAVAKASLDPAGFGAKWTRVADEPCPGEESHK